MGVTVIALRPVLAAADAALAATEVYLQRCKLAARTVTAYRRQCRAYLTWLAEPVIGELHLDAFFDVVGAEAAVAAWRRHQLDAEAAPATVNQGLAALTLFYEHGVGLRIKVKRVRVPRPAEPEALTPAQQGAVERAATRRGVRDAAVITVLLHAGARVQECARLDLDDVAITARTGRIRLHGNGDEVRWVPLPVIARARISAWINNIRGRQPGRLFTGQRGPLSISGITQVVLAVGADASQPGLRPHRLRHTYATRLRQGGADLAHVQALLGHAFIETSARYFRAGETEQAAIVEKRFRS